MYSLWLYLVSLFFYFIYRKKNCFKIHFGFYCITDDARDNERELSDDKGDSANITPLTKTVSESSDKTVENSLAAFSVVVHFIYGACKFFQKDNCCNLH